MSSPWPFAPLGQLLDLLIDHRGRTPKKLGSDFTSSGVRVISAKNIRGGRLDLSFEPRYVSEDVYQRWMSAPLQQGDVLLTSEAPMGEVAYLNGAHRFCLGQRLFALRPNAEQLDARFLYYWLRSPAGFARLHGRLSGTTAQGIRQSQLVQVEVPVPPIAEQNRIAGVLGALDDKIAHDESLATRLQEAAALAVDRTTRECAAAQTVYDFAIVTYGAAFKSALFGQSGTPVLRIRDLATHSPSVMTTEVHPRGRVVMGGDIVVGMDGEFRAHVWHGPRSLLNQRLCVFDPKPNVSRAFVWRGIQAPLARVEATETGTTVIHLGKADIDEFELPMPGAEAMEHLRRDVDPLVDLAVGLHREAQHLAAVRDMLVPKLVSGAVRVPDSYDPDDALGTVAQATGVTVP